MADRAPPRDKEPNKRQAAAEELAAKIKKKVESAQAAIKGSDTSVPVLMGICQALNGLVPMLVKDLKHSHSTAGLARDLSVCSHVLLTASREAALKFQKKNMIAGKNEEEVHADDLMKFICTHYVALDGTITSTVEFPKMKDDPKSKDSTKKRKSAGPTKERAVKKIEEVIEDIGFALDGSKNFSKINYDYTPLIGDCSIENPKNLIEHLTTLQYQINEASDEFKNTLSVLKKAKKDFDASYEDEHGDIPDDSEDTFKEYEQARKAAVKDKSKANKDWKKSLDNANTAYAEKEVEIKQKVAKLKNFVEQWKVAREAESESPPEKKQKKDSDSDSGSGSGSDSDSDSD